MVKPWKKGPEIWELSVLGDFQSSAGYSPKPQQFLLQLALLWAGGLARQRPQAPLHVNSSMSLDKSHYTGFNTSFKLCLSKGLIRGELAQLSWPDWLSTLNLGAERQGAKTREVQCAVIHINSDEIWQKNRERLLMQIRWSARSAEQIAEQKIDLLETTWLILCLSSAFHMKVMLWFHSLVIFALQVVASKRN